MIVRPGLPLGRVAAYVGWPVAVHVVIAAGIAVLHDYYGARWFAVPALPVTILASTIGILLAFRNNSGYDRWWEARTLWGGFVNQSRTFARQVLTYLPAAIPAEGRADGRATDGAADGDGQGGSADARDDVAVVGDRVDDRRRATSLLVSTSPVAASAVHPAARTREAGEPTVAPSDGAVRDRQGRAGPVVRSTVNEAPIRDRPAAKPAAPAAPSQLAEHCTFDAISAEARELVYAQIGFVNAVRCHLRRQDPFADIAPFLRPSLVEALRTEQNVPAAILVWMATRLRRLFAGRRVDDAYRLVTLDDTLTELTNLLGGCERIKNTPIPRQYDWLPYVVTRAYLLFLPLAVVDELGLATPFVTAVVAFLFLFLDAIGRNVEAPFENDIHDTPMTALCRTIEINLRQMLGETSLPPAVQPVDGYLY